MKNLGIYGSGGLGREVYEIASRRNSISSIWDKILFIDDTKPEELFFGTKIINFETLVKLKNDFECIIAVGEPKSREKLFQKLKNEKISLTYLIDPSSIISPTTLIKEGTIICEFVTIHANIELGYNILIQPFSDIGHDIKIGDHTVLGPSCNPGGGVVFGDKVYVGMNSTILENLKIGDSAIIGMGSVVYRDVPENLTVIGNPARTTKGNDDHKVFYK